jgi:hypothetical protein
MKKTFFLFALLFTLPILSGCAKIYYSPDAMQKASTHKIIAIIAPKVAATASATQAQQLSESLNYQKEIYAWMLKRKSQGKITVDIQELDVTNIKLTKLDYYANPISSSQLCKELGVDGVITSSFSVGRTMSEGSALGVALLTGAFVPTKNATIDLSINDSEKLLFNYSYKVKGGIASTPARMIDRLMREASRKMPYVTNLSQ